MTDKTPRLATELSNQIIQLYPSQRACAKRLGVTQARVSQWSRDGIPLKTAAYLTLRYPEVRDILPLSEVWTRCIRNEKGEK